MHVANNVLHCARLENKPNFSVEIGNGLFPFDIHLAHIVFFHCIARRYGEIDIVLNNGEDTLLFGDDVTCLICQIVDFKHKQIPISKQISRFCMQDLVSVKMLR